MRILFSSQPMFGHVNTVLPTAEAAQRAGHEVLFVTGESMIEYVARRGVDARAVGVASAPRGPETDWIRFFTESAVARTDDLLPLARDWSPDLVVHEDTELGGAVVSAALGTQEIVHGLGLMPPLRLWDLLAPALDEQFRGRGIDASPDRVRAASYLEVCPPSFRLPGERIWPHAEPLRPVWGVAAAGEALPRTLDGWGDRPLVHLTLGTVFNQSVDVLESALEGLRDLPVGVVVTTGPGTDPSVLGAQPDHVLVASYLPHSLLLPRCDLVVSQGGAGVLFGALAHGVPQLVLPQGADQDMNAEALVAAGAGLQIGRGQVTADRVAAAASRVLAEPAFTAAAQTVQAEIAAMPSVDEVISRVAC